MNICIPQTVHNHPKTVRKVGRSPYLVHRAERVLFINSSNSFILFPCRTTRVPCRIIAPLTLPIVLKFMSPPLCCPQWDVTPSTYLRSEKPFSIRAITCCLRSLLSAMILTLMMPSACDIGYRQPFINCQGKSATHFVYF